MISHYIKIRKKLYKNIGFILKLISVNIIYLKNYNKKLKNILIDIGYILFESIAEKIFFISKQLRTIRETITREIYIEIFIQS